MPSVKKSWTHNNNLTSRFNVSFIFSSHAISKAMKFIGSFTNRTKTTAVNSDRISDDDSMASSSVYTTSKRMDFNLFAVIEEVEDEITRNDDDNSRGSTLPSQKTARCSEKLSEEKDKTKRFYWADGESYTGSMADSEDYDIAEIESQLQEIKFTSSLSKGMDRTLKNDVITHTAPMEQAPSPFSVKKDSIHPENESLLKLYKKTIFVVCMLCAFLFFIIVGILISKVKESTGISNGSSTEALPNGIPKDDLIQVPSIAADVPTMAPMARISNAPSTLEVIALPIATNFKPPTYPPKPETTKPTKAPSSNPFMPPTSKPTLVPISTQLTPIAKPSSLQGKPITNQWGPVSMPTMVTSPNQGFGGGAVCEDDPLGSFYIGSDARNCAWLASKSVSQTLFCKPKYADIYDLCKKTCNNCS
jgi:hypothetical protein